MKNTLFRAHAQQKKQTQADNLLFTVLFCVVCVVCGVVALATYFDVLVK